MTKAEKLRKDADRAEKFATRARRRAGQAEAQAKVWRHMADQLEDERKQREREKRNDMPFEFTPADPELMKAVEQVWW